MGFLNTDSMPRLVEKLADGDNIKITGNSKGSKVGTVVKKIVEKADDVTKAIEQEVVNDSYSFKVGTGDVDVSSDVEDGFSEVGVKGVTYQNLWNINKVNGATIEGNTVKVLASANDYKFCGIYLEDSCLKPNTTYTLITNVFENTLDGRFNPCIGHSASVFKTNAKEFQAKTTGVSISVLTTASSFTTENIGVRTFVLNDCTEGFIKYNILILEGDYSNASNLPSYFEDIVGVGDKSKNLFKEPPVKLKAWSGNYLNHNIGVLKLKKNTTYSIVHNANKTLPDGRINVFEASINEDNTLTLGSSLKQILLNGASTFTTGSCDICLISAYKLNSADATEDVILDRLCIREGNEKIYEPYYDGYKIDILSNTRSVSNEDFLNHVASFGIGNIKCEKYLGKLRFTAMGAHYEKDFYDKRTLRLIPNTKYTLKMIIDVDTPSTYIIAGALNKTKITNTHYEFTTDSTGMVAIYPFSTGTNFVNVPFDIVIEPSDSFPNDLNYKEYKSQILLNEPLMRLPNGVCDEITRDGKLIRRVGKVVLDGNELERYTMEDNKATTIFFHHRNIEEITSKGLLCNTFVAYSESIYNEDKEGVYCVSGIKFRIAKSKLSTLNADGFKQWLKANPTTVYYELSTPIITELPAPCLRIFKDGYITFNTLVAPESNHVVQLNKSAQIERSIREVQSLDSRVGKLESFYDDMMLETSHKLSLLNYDFEYTRERNGE